MFVHASLSLLSHCITRERARENWNSSNTMVQCEKLQLFSEERTQWHSVSRRQQSFKFRGVPHPDSMNIWCSVWIGKWHLAVTLQRQGPLSFHGEAQIAAASPAFQIGIDKQSITVSIGTVLSQLNRQICFFTSLVRGAIPLWCLCIKYEATASCWLAYLCTEASLVLSKGFKIHVPAPLKRTKTLYIYLIYTGWLAITSVLWRSCFVTLGQLAVCLFPVFKLS